jgi:hypothetical protein
VCVVVVLFSTEEAKKKKGEGCNENGVHVIPLRMCRGLWERVRRLLIRRSKRVTKVAR